MISTTDLERMLDRIHTWTRAADQKVYVLVLAEGAVATLIAPGIASWYTIPALSPFRWGVSGAILLWTAAVVYATRALYARTKNPYRHTTPSLTFFGDISRMSLDTYRKMVDDHSDPETRSDFVSQIHVSATICSVKYDHFNKSVVFFFTSLGLIGLCYAFRQ